MATLAGDVGKSLTWKQLPSLPDAEGFAGSFAGAHHGALIVAGGSNFPEKRPWEGGTKVWYDKVFVLEKPDGAWKEGFKLSQPIGYGVSINTKDGLLCIGGSSAKAHHAEVTLVSYEPGKVKCKTFPKLPSPCANMCGAMLGNVILVAGGSDNPDATNAMKTLWSLDLIRVNAGWKELEPCPGSGRIFGAAGIDHGSFILAGGAALTAGTNGKPAREWLRDVWRYTPGKGWERLADLPRPAVAAPSPMPNLGGCLLLGGDDGAQISVGPTEHKGFPRGILRYESAGNRWVEFGTMPFALVTTTMTVWNGAFIVAGGEQKPGVRSPEVWAGHPMP